MNQHSPESLILEALHREGPMTGAELADATGLEMFTLWKACLDHPSMEWCVVGNRYLRLDRTVSGYGRLSPSIKREFLTYTVLAVKEHASERDRRVHSLEAEIRAVSREKFLLARTRLRSTLESLEDAIQIQDSICLIIAGDIVFEMAHAVPRPEISTGKMVRGSDLDIVIVHRDSMPRSQLDILDRAILKEKYHLLTHPTYREEIDYIIKSVSKVKTQLKFETFEQKVASKILNEGHYLLGSRSLFEEVKHLIQEEGVPAKLDRLEEEARSYRISGEKQLKECSGDPSQDVLHRYFYTKEEDPEIY